jgi:hypothetical protein
MQNRAYVVAIAAIIAVTIVLLSCILSATVIVATFLQNPPWVAF